MAAKDRPAEQHNAALPGGTVNAVQNGDLYVFTYQNEPPYRLHEFPSPPGPARDVARSRAPSWLLSSGHQIVPFHGRGSESDLLGHWRDDKKAKFSVQLIHGPGGQGKTRLAARFAAASSEGSWTVRAARHRSELAPGGGDHQVAVHRTGLLVVVDYAERWPLDDLVTMLGQHRDQIDAPVRMLLLARSAGGWWQSLAYQLAKNGITGVHEWELMPLATEPLEQQLVYTVARDRFASALGYTEPAAIPVPALDGPEFELVLSVHMKALVDVDAASRGLSPPSGRQLADLSSYLLARERDYWRAANDRGRGPIQTRELAMARTVYVATLSGPLGYDQAVETLTQAGITETSLTPVGQVLADHQVLYPPVHADSILQPLYPDRLGEDFVALTTAGHGLKEFQPDPWAEPYLARLSGPPRDRAAMLAVAPAIVTLIQAAIRWPHLAIRHLSPLLRRAPYLALATGGSALTALAENPAIDIATLEGIESVFPDGRDVDLDVGIAAVAARLTDHRLVTTTDPGERGQLYWTLGHLYGNAGLVRLAVTTTRQAVEVYRQLAAHDSREFGPLLTGSLTNLSALLFRDGDYQEALLIARDVVGMCRKHVDAGDGAYLGSLADALTSESLCLAKLGETEKALTAAEDALEIRQALAPYLPEAFEKNLATILDTIGTQLWRLGQRQKGLAATSDAVAIRRRLAEANPSANEPELAASLNSLGIRLAGLGNLDAAVTVSGEAVAISRRLSAVNPNAFGSGLADALQNRAIFLVDSGQPRKALVLLEEAVERYRALMRINHALYEPSLASCLNKLASARFDLGLRDDAMALIEEAIGIYRRLAAAVPLSYLTELAAALTNLAAHLTRSGEHARALPVAREAVDIRRQQAATQPGSYDHKLAGALSNLAPVLAGPGMLDEALTSTNEALTIRRGLAAAEPGAFSPDLATSLYNLGNLLDQRGEPAQAVAPTREAADIYRRLADAHPAGFKPRLAEALENLGIRLIAAQEAADALDLFEEVVAIRRQLASAEPGLFEPLLSSSLLNLGQLLLLLGRPDQGRIAVEEALSLLSPLVQRHPQTNAKAFVHGLQLYAELLDSLGEVTQAASIRQFLASRRT